jgi:small subunit ribosomal protein S13
MRILGITIPNDKRLEIGLTALFGVGRSRAQKILDEAKVEWGITAADLSPEK